MKTVCVNYKNAKMKTIYVHYMPTLDSVLWTCVPETCYPVSYLEVDENVKINGVSMSDVRGVTVDFINNDAYGTQGIPGYPPEIVNYLEMGTAEDVYAKLVELGYKIPTVEELCEEYGTHIGQFEVEQ